MTSSLSIWISGAGFALVHSLTASNPFKSWIYQRAIRPSSYRLFYTLVSIVLTAVWAWYLHQLPDTPLYQLDGFFWFVCVVLQLLGAGVALAAFYPMDGLVFLGFRAAQKELDPFVISGIYRWIRHPMYSGAMLILLAMPEQTWNGLQFALLVSLYFVIGSKLEEGRMLKEHPDYADYQKSVPSFIPCLSKRI